MKEYLIRFKNLLTGFSKLSTEKKILVILVVILLPAKIIWEISDVINPVVREINWPDSEYSDSGRERNDSLYQHFQSIDYLYGNWKSGPFSGREVEMSVYSNKSYSWKDGPENSFYGNWDGTNPFLTFTGKNSENTGYIDEYGVLIITSENDTLLMYKE